MKKFKNLDLDEISIINGGCELYNDWNWLKSFFKNIFGSNKRNKVSRRSFNAHTLIEKTALNLFAKEIKDKVENELDISGINPHKDGVAFDVMLKDFYGIPEDQLKDCKILIPYRYSYEDQIKFAFKIS